MQGGAGAYLPLIGAVALGAVVTAATYGAGAPVATALVAGAAGATAGAAATGAVQQGVEQKQAADFQKASLKRDQELAQTQASERAAGIRETMRRALGAQAATLASRGIDPGGFGTPDTLRSSTIAAGNADLLDNNAWLAASRDTLRTDANQLGMAGDAALGGGITRGVGSLLQGAISAYSIGAPRSPAAAGGGAAEFGSANASATNIFGSR